MRNVVGFSIRIASIGNVRDLMRFPRRRFRLKSRLLSLLHPRLVPTRPPFLSSAPIGVDASKWNLNATDRETSHARGPRRRKSYVRGQTMARAIDQVIHQRVKSEHNAC